MNAPTRRAFLGFAQGAVAAAAVGAIGVRFISSAEAMPVAANLGQAAITTDLATQAQWGPPHGPGWGAAATAQAPLGLLVVSRSPPLRVAVEVTVRDPFADGKRTALCFRSDQLCFTAAIGCEARRAGSR